MLHNSFSASYCAIYQSSKNDITVDWCQCRLLELFLYCHVFEGYTILCLTFFIVQYGQTPLHYASMFLQRIEAMKILTDNGADLNVTDKVSHCQSWCCVWLYVSDTCL